MWRGSDWASESLSSGWAGGHGWLGKAEVIEGQERVSDQRKPVGREKDVEKLCRKKKIGSRIQREGKRDSKRNELHGSSRVSQRLLRSGLIPILLILSRAAHPSPFTLICDSLFNSLTSPQVMLPLWGLDSCPLWSILTASMWLWNPEPLVLLASPTGGSDSKSLHSPVHTLQYLSSGYFPAQKI